MKCGTLVLLAMILTSCTGKEGPAGPAGQDAISSLETYSGSIQFSNNGSPTEVPIRNADDALISVYVYMPADDAWIQANAYAEDAQDVPFVFSFALIYRDKVDIYSASGSKYRIYALRQP